MNAARDICAAMLSIAIAAGFTHPTLAADGSNEPDSAEPSYTAETAGGCVYSLELYDAGRNTRGLGINGPVSCRATLAEELSAISDLLDQVRRDGHAIGGFRTFSLGRIRPSEWHERIADCYIAKFGADERAFHDATAVLKSCPFFPELTRVFEDKGVRVRLREIEKIEWVDLKLLATGDPSGFGEIWGKVHRDDQGRVPIGARAFFEIENIDRN